jgi:ATP-binding cassette subfamily B protein/subfamily B ATP-binding cassette protein MsbA
MLKRLRLLRYAWPYWRSLGVILATILLHVGLNLLTPWPLKFLIDDVLDGKAVPPELERALEILPGPGGLSGLLLWVCISTVLLVLIRCVIDMANTVAAVSFGQRMVYALAADLFLRLQRMSPVFHSRQPVGDMVSRISGDTHCMQVLLVSVLLPLLESMLALGSMFLVMWQIQPSLTLLSLAVVPMMMLIMWRFGKPMEERSRVERDMEGEMMATAEQALSAIPAVQAFNREEVEHRRFQKQADAAVSVHLASSWLDMWFKLFIDVVLAAGTAAIMWFGARLVLSKELTTGDIVVFLGYLHMLYDPLNAIIHSGSAMQHAAGSADRVLEIVDMPPDVRDLPGAQAIPLKGHVRYEGVTFGYEPGRPVIKGLSLEVRPGEVIAIVGPNGAGKTTLANMLVRFFDPWSGRVTVDGRDIRQYSLRSLREQVALVLQEPFIFPLSAADNIAYGRPDASRADIEAAARAANADAFIRRLPNGYDSVIGERGATLSGGEKQRLSIARAFLKDAPILILDEPTSALDAATEEMLIDAIERLMKDRTTIIIAHRLSTIRSADRILVLNTGEIVQEGRHDELMALDGHYAGLYRQQMEFARHDLQPSPTLNGGA